MPNFLSYSTPTGRLGYWTAFFITVVLGMLIYENVEVLAPLGYGLFIFILLLWWVYCAACMRRLNDLDRSRWWVLLNIIPIGQLVLIIWLGFFPGNEY